MNIINYSADQFITFLMILFRLSGLMIFAPFWGSRNIMPQLKIGISLFTAVILFPMIPVPDNLPHELIGFALLSIMEIGIGIILGFGASLMFTGIQMSGQMVSHQMGHALANVIDPLSESQATVIGQFQFFFSVLVFLTINGHHWLLRAVISSFKSIPLGGMSFNPFVVKELTDLFGDIFRIAFLISAPVLVALFLTSVAMGFIARTVPQVHVLVVGFPIQLAVGMVTLGYLTTYLGSTIVEMIQAQFNDLSILLRAMSPGFIRIG